LHGKGTVRGLFLTRGFALVGRYLSLYKIIQDGGGSGVRGRVTRGGPDLEHFTLLSEAAMYPPQREVFAQTVTPTPGAMRGGIESGESSLAPRVVLF